KKDPSLVSRGTGSGGKNGTGSPGDKYLEAPHLKAVGAAMREAGIGFRRLDGQVHTESVTNCRSPTVPATADIPQITLASRAHTRIAEARGGATHSRKAAAAAQNRPGTERAAPGERIANRRRAVSGPLNLSFTLPQKPERAAAALRKNPGLPVPQQS
ncbi:hypothetical protein, partial [uncultured Rikenella sp.]|uniref:hypothetical protein n=1 Tax=uncultured Rikenella sp. TaxID=368003 RepID=UPI002606EFAA